MRVKSLFLSTLAAGFLMTGGLAVAQQPDDARPEGRRPGARLEGRGEGRPEGRGEGRPGQFRPGQFQGGPGPFRPGQVLPPMLVQRLELSAEQIEQLETLQTEVRARLERILTEEQRSQMREMAARGPQRPGAEGRGAGAEGRGRGAEGRGRGGERGPAARGAEGAPRRGGTDEDRALRERRRSDRAID